MHARLHMIAVALLAAISATAWAQEVGEPAPDLEFKEAGEGQLQGKLLERLHDRIIVLVFWRTIDPESVELFPMLNELHEKYFRRGVSIIAVTDEKKEKAEKVFKEKEAKFASVGWSNPEAPYDFPAPGYAYIVDIHGNIAYARFNAKDDLEGKILNTIANGPPPGADDESVAKRMARMSELVAKGSYGRAYTVLQELKDVFDPGRLMRKENEQPREGEGGSGDKKLGDVEKQINEGVEKVLKEIRDQVEAKDYPVACARLSELSVRLLGSKLKEDVDREVARLQGDNATKEMIRKALENAKGEVKLDHAAALEEVKLFVQARDVYRDVIDNFAGTESARVAEQALDRLSTDPSVKEEIAKKQATQQAARWFDLGERYAKAELFDQARQEYQKVVKDYAGTAVAEKARKRLDALPAEEATAKAEADKRAEKLAEQKAREEERKKQEEAESKDKKPKKPDKTDKPDKPDKPTKKP